MEVVRPFEPRRGSTLVEQPPLFCGVVKNNLMYLPWMVINMCLPSA